MFKDEILGAAITAAVRRRARHGRLAAADVNRWQSSTQSNAEPPPRSLGREQNYVEPVDDKDLIYDAINGMLRSLDPHIGS